jgi:molybdopterin converting factor small subunit
MGKVIIKVPPFFASALDPDSSGWFIVETDVVEKMTIRELLTGIAINNPVFRQTIFNPDDGNLNDQIDIVLNQKFLPFPHALETKLIDGDIIILLPVLSGG